MSILNQQDEALQRIKLEELQHVLGNLDNYRDLDLSKLIDPNNKNWADYTYWSGSHNNRIKRQGHIGLDTPEGIFINNIRNAGTIGRVYKQSELWDEFDPLSSRDNAGKYFRYVVPLTQAYDHLDTLNRPDDSPTTLENGSGTPTPDQPPVYDGFGGIKTRREKLQEAIDNSNANNPYLGGNYGSRRPGWGLVDENPQPQAPVKSAGKSGRVRQGRSRGNLSRSGSNTYATAGVARGGNTYATAGTPRGGVVSPATMMRTSGVPPVQASYGMNAPRGEGVDYTLTYDPIKNQMVPNDPYSYYDPSRNAPSSGTVLTYDPIKNQMVPDPRW